MTRRRQSLSLLMLLVGAESVAGLSGCGSNSIPEILRGVSAGGGYWGACPRDLDFKSSPSALSPEFNARLASRYPPGSADTVLISGLTAAGFKSAGVCKSEPNTKILAFSDKNTIPNVVAEVYWQADSERRIAWTKGFVRYIFF
jgi:hypothetical protein